MSAGRLRAPAPAPLAGPTGQEGAQQQRADGGKEGDAVGGFEAAYALVADLFQSGENLRLRPARCLRGQGGQCSRAARRQVILSGHARRLAHAKSSRGRRLGILHLLPGQTHLNCELRQARKHLKQIIFFPACEQALALDAALRSFLLFEQV